MINGNWCDLPVELLMSIVENHLPSVDDVIVFSSVCGSWNRAARACDKSKLTENGIRQMPWLMLTDGNEEVYSDTGSDRQHRYEGNVMGLKDDDDFYYTSSSDEDEVHLQSDENGLSIDSYYYPDVKDGDRRVLNLSHNRNKCYNLSLLETYGKACWGARYGWMVTLGLDRQMHLFNPLTKAQLPLPSQTTFRYPWKRARDKTIRHMFLTKVIVLRLPQDDNNLPWLVVAIHRDYSLTAIARPGDASWMHVIRWQDDLDVLEYGSNNGHCFFVDIIYFSKLKSLLSISVDGDLFSYDVHNSQQPQMFMEYLHGPDFIGCLPSYGMVDVIPYLVEYVNDLFVVARYTKSKLTRNMYFDGGRRYMTESFRVFRLSKRTTTWEELSDLGNVAVFVGQNETICVDASNAGCRRNCIYFCDDGRISSNRDKVGGHDMGLFNLGAKTIETIDVRDNWKSSYCTPFWFSPEI